MIKILLIDDEELVRDELGGLLEDNGYEVITGADGEEGLELFRSERPDMVFTDVRMPRRNGLSLALSIRQEAPHVPVTVITGHGSESMVIKALRSGVTDFIKKPVHLEHLITALGRMETARRPIIQSGRQKLPLGTEELERSWIYTLKNTPAVVPDFVDLIIRRCALSMHATSAVELVLALRELILNAIGHGNLGLTAAEKSKALETNTLTKVLQERAQRPEMAKRRTAVKVIVRAQHITVRISDQGEGFDWSTLPDPLDPSNLLSAHGRGILLARMSGDNLVFNDAGNEVIINKSLSD